VCISYCKGKAQVGVPRIQIGGSLLIPTLRTLSFSVGKCVRLLTLKVRILPNATRTFVVFQKEHQPLASNRGTHLHTEKSR